MPEIIKQISVYDGSSWETKNIGANAGNILLSSSIAGSTNLQTALGNILPASQLTANQVLIAGSNNKITTSGISATQLGYLDGVTDKIQDQIDALKNSFGNLKIAYYHGIHTFPAGTAANPSSTDISIISVLPSGATVVGATVKIGSLALPYHPAGVADQTWVWHIESTLISIRNATSAWSNYDVYAVIFYY